MAIYAWSDLHVDFPRNLEIIQTLSKDKFIDDSLIIAGDLSDRIELLKIALQILKDKFEHVFFVPGNHDLWIRKHDFHCSLAKQLKIESICNEIGINTTPIKIPLENGCATWIVPLLSWYSTPDDGEDSLYIKKVGEDSGLKMWMDTYRVKWQSLSEKTPAEYFAHRNEAHITKYDAPVISFSHFLPNQEVIFPDKVPSGIIGPFEGDPHPTFNFTMVAGTRKLQEQIDRLGSSIHFYGHQHRNKIKIINEVKYISHCMGYPEEERYSNTGDKLEPIKLLT